MATIKASTGGGIYWNDTEVSNIDALVTKLAAASKLRPQPEVLIRGDVFSPSRSMGKILLACQRAGIMKVAFISESSPLCV
jgi:biopolymer transport protein ExbD